MGLYFVTCLDTKHIKWHMVPSFLYDRAKSALPRTPLPPNPSWSTASSIFTKKSVGIKAKAGTINQIID